MNKISAKHFALFIVGAIAISFATYPSLFISIGGRDTWISFIIAFLIFLVFSMYIIHVIDSKKPISINNLFTEGLSKTLGNILLFIFSIGLLLTAIESASVEANSMKTNFFEDTPIWYILIFFLLPSLFIIGKKFNTLVIFIIISISLLIFNGISLLLIIEKYKSIEFVLPVLGNGLNKFIIFSALLILGTLSSFSIVLPYIKFLSKDSKLKKHSFIIVLICGAISIYSLISILSIFGPIRAANLFYPQAAASQLVQIGGFLEFGELFFLLQTILGFFIKYTLCSYGIYLIYEKYIPNSKVFIIPYTILVFIASFFVANNNYNLFLILKYYQIINLFLLFIVPLLAFITYHIKKK